MEQRSDSLRERLLSRLPQPENLAVYREETASLLARHEKALASNKWAAGVLSFCAIGVLFVYNSMWNPKLDAGAAHMLLVIAGLMFFAAALTDIRYRIYESQVATLKEIKQVQLQMLELQASLKKDNSSNA